MTTTTGTTTAIEASMTASAAKQIDELKSLLSESEIIAVGHPKYEAASQTWSFGKNLRPKLVVQPERIETLSRVIKFLAQSTLDFNIQTSGVGSASAKDVLVSVRNFRDFHFDRENEVLTIGAGCLWKEYYEQMKVVAPEYSVVAAATPFLGLGGSIIAGGFSLISKEFGCISDPKNMLDVEVVKLDGSVVWASSEPDLLWAHRGGYIGLGAVTRFKLQAYKYPQNIWGGSIIIPREKEEEVANAVSEMDHSEGVEHRVFALLLPLPQCFVVNAFDAKGEEEGRKTFAPILRIEGAVDMTKVMDLEGFAQMQAPAEANKGSMHQWFNPLALGKLSAEVILKSLEWQRQCAAKGTQAVVMYELWGTRGSSSGPAASAWPRSHKARHFCMLSMTAAADATAEQVSLSRKLIQEAPTEVLAQEFDNTLTATSGLEDFHNFEGIYGQHWEKIVAVKRAYDPNNRLAGSPLARAVIEHIQRNSVPLAA